MAPTAIGEATASPTPNSSMHEALRYGTVTPNGAGYVVEHNLGRVIGTNIAGDAASSIRIFVRDALSEVDYE